MTATTLKVDAAFRITASHTPLIEAVRFIVATLPTRNVLPVLGGVLIEAGNNGLTFSGFDYEVATHVKVPGEGTGKMLVPGKMLLELLKGLDKGCDVELRNDGTDKVVLEADGFTYRLPNLPIDDYPTLPKPATHNVADFDVEMREGMASTLVAAGRDDALPALTAVRFGLDRDGVLELAATDRYRLAVFSTGLKMFPDEQPFLVPADAIAMVVKQFAKAKTVRVSSRISTDPKEVSTGVVTFSDGTKTVTIRVLDAAFPKYASLLPDSHAVQSVVDIKRLTKAVKGVAVVASRTSPVRLGLNDDGVTLTAGGKDDTEASYTVPSEGHTGDDLVFAVNPTYLLDGLGAVGGDKVTLRLTGATKPVIIINEERPDFRYLQMPVRLAA